MINTIARVTELASQKNLSIHQLCELSSVNQSTFSTAKRRYGQLSLDTIDRFCETLGITLGEFFEGDRQ